MTRKYPTQVEINGKTYKYEKILKDDFFSVNVLYRHTDADRYVLKLSDFRFIFGKLLRPFAIWMSSHEYRIYQMVKDLDGVPELGPRLGWRGYFHEYIEGKTLHELGISNRNALPDSFFDELKYLIRQLHQRRIYYVDLNKRGNIILGDDGKPWLIDYQICQHFKPRRGWLGRLGDRIFNRLIQEDIYHIYKHKKKFQPHLITEQELILARRSKLAKRYDKYWGRPYRRIKRKIYPSGSNEIIWYKWNKMRDQTKRTS